MSFAAGRGAAARNVAAWNVASGGVAGAGVGPGIGFEKRRLQNGLSVVVHQDRSDPLIAVQVAYHVGSAREERGRSGFAHLFEHMLFQGSAHVPEGFHFKAIHAAGGSLNGTTGLDRTVYYETVPKNHLELVLWLESDRMGFLLPAMTQAKLDNQRDVVQNERRQNYDNRPYGRVPETIAKELFPDGHPYQWLPIGSMEDIAAATLEDVAAFFRRWYGPENATLCIAGDIEPARAFELAERWFGPIPSGAELARRAAGVPSASGASGASGASSVAGAPRLARLAAERRVTLEDRVALPQLSLCWMGAPQFTDDAAALELAAMVLSQNKASVLDRALMVETTLARAVGAGHWSAELGGRFDITVRASPGVGLDELEARVRALLAGVVERGVDPEALARMQRRCEADVVRGGQTLAGRAASLSEYDLFTGDPGGEQRELARLCAVTPERVRAAIRDWLVEAPAVVLACVPAERSASAPRAAPPATSSPKPAAARPSGSNAAPRAASTVELGVAPPTAPMSPTAAPASLSAAPAAPTAGVDRTRAPASGAPPPPTLPHSRVVDRGELEARVAVTSFTRAPWASASLALPMGRRAETESTVGGASLTAALLSEGTQRFSTIEFTDRLEALGASLSIHAGDDEVLFVLGALERSLDEALELLFEAALEPRFDPADHGRVLTQRRTAIAARAEDPQAVAARVFARLIHGASPLGRSAVGGEVQLERWTLEHVREFHARGAHRRGARFALATSRDLADAERLAERFVARLPAAARAASGAHVLSNEAAGRDAVANGGHGSARLFVVDRPGAEQTQLIAGHFSVATTHPDFVGLGAVNFVLGGSFNSRINLNLRESKGYTYGARSQFTGGVLPGAFSVSAAVETSVTADAAREILRELDGIRAGVRQEEWDFARTAMLQSLAMQLESSDARRRAVDLALKLGWPVDYPLRRARELERLTIADLDRMAREHIVPSELFVLAVGDAARIEAPLGELGLGPARRVTVDGLPGS